MDLGPVLRPDRIGVLSHPSPGAVLVVLGDRAVHHAEHLRQLLLRCREHSSGESELYATLKAASEGLGMLSIARDIGIHLAGEVWGDAAAALGIINRKGLDKTRHIDTGFLWVQQVAAEKRLKFGKVLGRDNPADLYTKYLDWETIRRHCNRMSSEFDEGRAESAPQPAHTQGNLGTGSGQQG